MPLLLARLLLMPLLSTSSLPVAKPISLLPCLQTVAAPAVPFSTLAPLSSAHAPPTLLFSRYCSSGAHFDSRMQG